MQNQCVLAQQPANNFAQTRRQLCGTSSDCSRRGEFEKNPFLILINEFYTPYILN